MLNTVESSPNIDNAAGLLGITTSGWSRHRNILIGAVCALSAVYSHVILEHERMVSIQQAFMEDDDTKPLKYFFAHLWLWLVFLTASLSTLRNIPWHYCHCSWDSEEHEIRLMKMEKYPCYMKSPATELANYFCLMLCPEDEVWTLLHLCFAILTESLGLHCLTAEFCLAVSADTLEAVGIMQALLLTFLVFRLNRSVTSVVEALAIAGMSISSRRYAGAVGGLLLLLAELLPQFRDYDFLAIAIANPLFSVALNGKGLLRFLKYW